MDEADGCVSQLHKAAHVVDAYCCTVLSKASDIIDELWLIGAGDDAKELQRVLSSMHEKAKAAHRKFEGNA